MRVTCVLGLSMVRTTSGSAALWVSVRRRASWKMAGVICPIDNGTEEMGVGRTRPRQGNGAPGGSVGSGERAIVSICVRCDSTSDGVVRKMPDLSSRMTERSVGSVEVSVVPPEVLRMDLSATSLGFSQTS